MYWKPAPPAVGVAPPSDFVISRSTDRTTEVFAVDSSFAGLVSFGVVTFAVFTMTSVPGATPAPAFTTTVIDGAAPTARLVSVQLTEPLSPTAGVVQVQPAPALSDTNVVPAGSGSLTCTGAATGGP